VLVSDSYVPRTAPHFPQVDRAIAKYPYDVRQTEALMLEAGFTKGAGGPFVNPSGEVFAFEHLSIAGTQNEKQGAVMADSWRRAGFDVKETLLTSAQTGDGQARSTFPALSSVAAGSVGSWASASISGPDRRWQGGNRGGWSNADYDRLYDAYQSSLDLTERNQLEMDMMKLVTENVATLFLFHNPDIYSFRSELSGPALVAPDAHIMWNVHQWELS
jgi:peptide/nickel transport system substrate-binding protein